MKNVGISFLSVVLCGVIANAGSYRPAQFEETKDRSGFDKVEVHHNFDLTFSFQALQHTFTPTGEVVKQDIQSGLILPTADLDITAKVLKGLNTKLEVMLSSHHHNETYVKGGWATIDSLDFVKPGFASEFMDKATIKIGVNDINFGDAHFRRTDNADIFNNPFILNMGVEAYMQAGFLELMYRFPLANMFTVVGVTNGQVNPDDVKASEGSDKYSYYGKVGYDNESMDNLRVRLSESIFTVSGTNKTSLYSGDKAGTVPREILNNTTGTSGNDFGSLWKALPSYKDLTVSMTNIFLKKDGSEFFGLVEVADGSDKNDKSLEMLHYSADLVQRFGDDHKYYGAVRYEEAKTTIEGDSTDDKLTQFQVTFGWFLSKNALAKVEYIKQERENFDTNSNLTYVDGKGKFEGYMINTALSF